MRIPKHLAEQTDITEGSEVELGVVNGAVTVRPKARSFTLEELLDEMTAENRLDEIAWGEPQTGRERAGRRPALVLSPAQNLRGAGEVSGVVLVDQLRSLDWRARRTAPAGRAPTGVLAEVMAKLRPLLGV